MLIDPSQARATPKEHHDGIVEHLVDNLRELETAKLLDKFKFIKEINRVFIIPEVDQISAAEVLHECLFGKWNKVEKRC